MTRDEVRSLMHDYFDNLLSAEERSTIESYLEEYPEIAEEYELLKKLLDKSKELPIGIQVPDTVLKKVSDELLSKSLEKIESDKQKRLRELTENTEKDGEKRKKLKGLQSVHSEAEDNYELKKSSAKSFKMLFIILVVLVLGVSGYFIYNYLNNDLPWKVKAEYGQYQISPNSANQNLLNSSETLSTFDSTKVSINVPNAGRLDLESFSSLKLLQGKSNDNIVSLLSGNLEAVCKADDPRLTIMTRPVNIIAKGGNFSVAISEQGDVQVKTNNGVVRLESVSEELYLIEEHICKTSSNGNIGLPYHTNSDSAFVNLVNKISFNSTQIIFLEKLLTISTPKDGITLLYLIKEVSSQPSRKMVFKKLNEFYPAPPGITEDGIINLDESMFDTWLKDIEWQI